MEVVLLVSGDGFDGVWRDDDFLNDGNFLLVFVGVVWNIMMLLKLMFVVDVFIIFYVFTFVICNVFIYKVVIEVATMWFTCNIYYYLFIITINI